MAVFKFLVEEKVDARVLMTNPNTKTKAKTKT
jgi:hypothetical protein